MPEIEEAALAWLNAWRHAVEEVAADATVVVGMGLGKEGEPIGTGVLVRLGGRAFVFTAAHVVKSPGSERLLALATKGSGEVIVLSGNRCIVNRHEGDIDDDRIDAAVIVLRDDEASELVARGHRFLSRTEIWTGLPEDGVPHGEWFSLYGYPRASATDREDAWTSKAVIYHLRPTPTRTVLPAFELELGYPDPNSATMVNFRGEPLSAVRPHGFSGAGLWQFDIAGTPHASSVRLSAIQHTWSPGTRVVRATLVPYFCRELLLPNFEEVGAALRLVLPAGR